MNACPRAYRNSPGSRTFLDDRKSVLEEKLYNCYKMLVGGNIVKERARKIASNVTLAKRDEGKKTSNIDYKSVLIFDQQ